MAQKTIFVQTDPSFDIVLRSLNELNAQRRLQVTHHQTAVIPRIRSNNPHDDNRCLFGAENESCIQSFARTASAVARMCMLRATNVDEKHWPKIGALSESRNKATLHYQEQNQAHGGNFTLAQTPAQAKRYYSKYDHLYPHFLIEHEFRSVGANHEVFLPSMMLIIDSDFTQVVEITTTFRAKRLPDVINLFQGYIHVVCIVRSINNLEGKSDEEFTQLLRRFVQGDSDGNRFSVKKEYFEVLSKATKKKGLKLPDLFENLNICKLKKEEESEEEDDEEEDL
ncbi:unnamed protein product [Porites evermanni]|uniref:Uncharacterized protein n=1 Tax=Porites evermanni TaxID=104178 RepID=A0ABN8Q5M4_9CNID|nr:unnamed protein product [Porites evermanni]